MWQESLQNVFLLPSTRVKMYSGSLYFYNSYPSANCQASFENLQRFTGAEFSFLPFIFLFFANLAHLYFFLFVYISFCYASLTHLLLTVYPRLTSDLWKSTYLIFLSTWIKIYFLVLWTGSFVFFLLSSSGCKKY